MSTKGIGIVGCGDICGIYFKNLTEMFENVSVVACSDLDLERAQKMAGEYPGVTAQTTEELLKNPAVDIVLNITPPAGHFAIARQAIENGKSVYNEKPLTMELEQGQELLRLAEKNGVRVGCAPDTFLGGGLQTCIKLVEDGAIGEPIGAQAFMLGHGAENWHPDPEFFYKDGSGPMLDMGPYYLTTLVALLGPAKRVTGSARISFPTRTIGSEKKKGQIIEVETPTHVTGIVDFARGPVATISTSFDVWASEVPRIEVFGSTGTLSVPDPNTFDGPVRIRAAGEEEWKDVEMTHGHSENSRGYGVSDMAAAIDEGRPHRASGELAFHVLEIMKSILEASEQGRHIELSSTCEHPASVKPL